MTTSFVVADSDELREAAYRFRYSIYVEHMGRRQLYADHVRKTVIEPQDEEGTTFVALRDGEIVGTIRSNRASDPSMAYYASLYRLERFGFADPSTIQITTKLMVHPVRVRSGLSSRMIRAYAKAAAAQGVTVDFIDCNRPLIPYFERMGYHAYCGWRVHKEYGSVRPMFYALDTVVYQRSIGSILVEPVSEYVRDGQYGGYELIRRHASPPAERREAAIPA